MRFISELDHFEKVKDVEFPRWGAAKKPQALTQGFLCDTVGSRTPNLLIRSQMLYPIELRCHR